MLSVSVQPRFTGGGVPEITKNGDEMETKSYLCVGYVFLGFVLLLGCVCVRFGDGPNPNPMQPARSKRCLPLSTQTRNIIENTCILSTRFYHFRYLFRAFCPKVAQGVQGPAPKCEKDPKIDPRGAQMEPKGAQMERKWIPGVPKWSPRVPIWSPRVPKWSPEVPQSAKRTPKASAKCH